MLLSSLARVFRRVVAFSGEPYHLCSTAGPPVTSVGPEPTSSIATDRLSVLGTDCLCPFGLEPPRSPSPSTFGFPCLLG
jgi:hypothetical protein